jgi:hypothetical protein
MNDDDYLNTQGAADWLKMKPDTLRAWRSRGQGPPFVKIEGLVRYRVADVKAWIDEQNPQGAVCDGD